MVSAQHITHQYQQNIALDDVSIAIPSGKMVGLIGPDGVGKSTLMALISGARKLQQGSLQVLEGNIDNAEERAVIGPRIAYMPQGLGKNLYAELSVQENLDFFGKLFNQTDTERASRIATLTQATGLQGFLQRPAGKLSGGMKQKLGLCCALIHDPDLLLLDEPTTGVDPLSRQQFWTLIESIRLARPQMSVIVSTAYMDEAERFDYLIAMDAGKILNQGSPQSMKTMTDSVDLETAFLRLLPAEKRANHSELVIPPLKSSNSELAIVAVDLTRKFGDFTAVNQVSFEIQQGEIFGFLGSNGCGKTTTMKMLTGLLPLSSGKAYLFGKAVDANDVNTRRRVGFMSQAFSLYDELTVEQNLLLHARLYHLTSEHTQLRIAELVQRFGLSAYMESKAAALPLGMR
ncbi:MAG: ATP-binding cassette domain-containing protein, partial [Glaciecola sp.]|nr:ATP-binding cassette domain-containing protein [Glaciecola sp.]